MNATEAKRITQENRMNNIPRWVFDAIERAANNGENRISFDASSIENPQSLIELGYTVKVDGLEYVVTW